jgi:lysophospholipase L1-like esterase
MIIVRRGWAVATIAVAAVLLLASPAAAADPGPPPSSMASLGDSITRGFNACGWYVDCASTSFSTGDNSSVNSHYLRIRTRNWAINGRYYNDARSGAKAADLPGQVEQAVAQQVGYVTILIGANDACTSSEASMSTVTTFRGSIDTALARLTTALPNVKVLIISVPDIKRLWDVGRQNLAALSAWSVFRVCQSMLANPTSMSTTDKNRRNRVRQRVIDFNAQLAAACGAYGANCVYDTGAVFDYRFVLGEVSRWDYFHPNTSGQTALARISYAAGFNW